MKQISRLQSITFFVIVDIQHDIQEHEHDEQDCTENTAEDETEVDSDEIERNIINANNGTKTVVITRKTAFNMQTRKLKFVRHIVLSTKQGKTEIQRRTKNKIIERRN